MTDFIYLSYSQVGKINRIIFTISNYGIPPVKGS